MTTYTIPPYLLDPQTLPPIIRTSEPGSFAYRTLAVRVPRIIQETIELNHFPDEIRRAVEGLREEILSGRVRGLIEDTPDREFWNILSQPEIGHSWLDVSWYWAESFFYRRMLEATGYFQPGPGYHQDPYHAIKQSELAPDAAPHKVATLLRALPAELEERFQALFHASLWGNRIDLSYRVAVQFGRGMRPEDEREYLLVDDSADVWRFLRAAPRRRIAILADNAGTELLTDLALIDFLLGAQLTEQLVLHVKPQPFFVSDTMPQDVDAGLAALAQGEEEARALAERIRGYQQEGRFQVYPHWFYPTCLFYYQLPEDLLAALSATDLALVKGDANYRRLIGDAHWDLTTPFDRVTRYFPAPLVAMRTFKSEELVGLAPGEGERLYEIDPDWLVNGRRGVIQANFGIANRREISYNSGRY